MHPFLATIRNICFYRKARTQGPVDPHYLDDVDNLAEARLRLTNRTLSRYGLVVVVDDKDTIPAWVYLTRAQKSIINNVAQYGFKVGLSYAKTDTGSNPGQRQSFSRHRTELSKSDGNRRLRHAEE